MGEYLVGQRVQATVERVLPFGVFVRLDDGVCAYIRQRELDLDADVEPAQVAREGNKFVAEVVRLGEPGKRIELSRRAILPDPWQDFARRFHEGDVVRGTVQALHPRGAFVRISPGVNGHIPLEELALWPVTKPDDLIWVGDSIEAQITYLDAPNKRLTMSLKAWMEKRDQTASIIERLEQQTKIQPPEIAPKKTVCEEIAVIAQSERERVGQIVVVDDHDELRDGLVNWMQKRGYQVAAAKTVHEALVQLQHQQGGVLFVDLNLSDSDGLDFVRRLQSNGSRVHICVMSSPEWLSERIEEIEAAGVIQVFEKPLDTEHIENFLVSLARGESVPPVWRGMPHQDSAGTIWRELWENEGQATWPVRRLNAALAKLTETTQAEKGILFVLDPHSRTFSILAEAGTVTIEPKALYELEDSPVKDVILHNKPAFTGHAKKEGRFRKLLNLLEFESCLGLPVEVAGEIHHAVFCFNPRPDFFSRTRMRGAMTGAMWVGAILETQALDQRLRSASPLLLSGELSQSFAHEVYNQVSGLVLQIRNLSTASNTSNLLTSMANLQASLHDLKTIVEGFQQMMQAKDAPTTFGVNEAVQRAERLLRPQARHEHAKIILRLAANLPPVTGNSIALQQVFFNLMLNAVQQMALKSERFKWDGTRILEISTAQSNQSDAVVVRFADAGPGIHKQLWDTIFMPSFSTRNGSGLGLFIARSLLDSLGGTVVVEESFIPTGTTFLVQLPVAK